MENEKPISLIGVTSPNDQTEQIHEFDHDGVITGALVGTEVGQEYELRNYAELIQNGSKTNLWDALDKEWLAGNGRDFDPNLRVEFSEGDKLRLRADNISEYPYHHCIMIHVDRETNLFERVTNAIRGAF